jgi:outer membrane protein assembly factor BamE (lipoprotein component of BamABCDE complex)
VLKSKVYLVTMTSLLSLILNGCVNNIQPQVNNINNVGKTTLGIVQKSIKRGMSSAEVIKVLGSPNMVTQDEDSNEVWIYDKHSTEIKSSNQRKGVWLLVVSTNEGSSSHNSSQKNLTIIIKFNSDNKVKKFSYRSSSF